MFRLVSVAAIYDGVRPSSMPATGYVQLLPNLGDEASKLSLVIGYTPAHDDGAARRTDGSERRHDNRVHRPAGRRLGTDRVQGDQRTLGRCRGHATTGRGRDPRARLSADGSWASRGTDPRAHLP